MKDLIGAIAEEKLYVADRMKQINTSLIDRLKPFGYETIEEYFEEKTNYCLRNWKPKVYRIDVDVLAETLDDAIINGKYGIYTPIAKGRYAFHGNDEIDRELCEKLGVKIIDLKYMGGTIIGSEDDFSFEIIAPVEFGLTHEGIIRKVAEIIGKKVDNVEIDGNDILIDGKKVMGSMTRQVGNSFVWAAQISFGEYDSYIEKICKKVSQKIAGYIKKEKLSKDLLENEVLAWLQ